MSEINICFTCDDNYGEYAAVTIASILSNADHNDQLTFYIISHNLSKDKQEKIDHLKNIKDFKIQYIFPNENLFKEYKDIKTIEYLPLASFYRLKIYDLVKDVDKIIYLDCDTTVTKSLSELYNTDISKYYCGGILDLDYKKYGQQLHLKKEKTYINSGVLLLNLKKWREEKAEEKIIEFAKNHAEQIHLGDQDLINKCFEDKILILDNKWNVQVINYFTKSSYSINKNIIHFMGSSKPWKFGSFMSDKKLYFKYLSLTEFQNPNKLWHIRSTIYGIFLFLKKEPLFLLKSDFYRNLIHKLSEKISQ